MNTAPTGDRGLGLLALVLVALIIAALVTYVFFRLARPWRGNLTLSRVGHLV
jgi:hypothetical protein